MRVSLRSSWVRSVRAAVRIFASLSRDAARSVCCSQAGNPDMLTEPMMKLQLSNVASRQINSDWMRILDSPDLCRAQ